MTESIYEHLFVHRSAPALKPAVRGYTAAAGMSTYARRRILLALAVLVIGGSGWLIAGQQRSAVIGMQGQLRASNDLLTAMLDQETGLRGYALTGDKAFLEPYVAGQRDFERSLREARAGFDRGQVIMGLLRDLTATARQWQANARTAVDQVERRGPQAISIDEARARKALTDQFRKQEAALGKQVEQRAQARLQRARWVAFGFVLLFCSAVLSLGLFALEREARRDRAQSKQRREYVEALQGAVDEPEAKELLRRQVERLAPGAEAVVLTRNASGNSLYAATDPAAAPGLAEALVDATPRSCLAIRHGNTHERKPGEAPLQRCRLCDGVPGGSLCVPELVSGEVIGVVLVIKDRAIKPAERDADRRRGHTGRPDARQPAQPRDRRAPRSHRPADQATQRPQRAGGADAPGRSIDTQRLSPLRRRDRPRPLQGPQRPARTSGRR